MRAGKLDRTIDVQQETVTVANGGTVTRAWVTFATMRAEAVNLAAVETAAAFGELETTAVVLRTRWRSDVTTKCRVLFDGGAYDVKSVTEIGRRRGLELRVELAK